MEAHGGEVMLVAVLPDDLWPEMDLAVLRFRDLRAPPLPVAAHQELPEHFWTKGFQWQGDNIRAAIPLHGAIPGRQNGLAYAFGDREYELPAVYALSEEDIDHGLSGAPLIDRRWGVVIGVVNATLRLGARRGYAIPIADAAQQVPSFGVLVSRNDRSVARSGPYLNALGAEHACARQLGAARERVASDKLVLLGRYAARPAIRAAVEDFFASGRPVLPLVGVSGVGKTTELVRLAHTLDRAALLIQASDLAGSGELAEALASRLPDDIGDDAPLDAVLEALRYSRPTILLDGLNEASLSPDVGTWFRRSLAWLEQHGMQLVLTCRWEQWQHAAAGLNSLLDRTVPMADFTEAEAGEARIKYGISEAVSPREIMHPLLARIYGQIGAQGDRTRSRHEMIEEYVRLKLSRVALGAGADDLAVEAALDDLVAGLDGQTLRISRQSVHHARAAHGKVVSALVDENLLVRAGPDFQFEFDEVSEYLQASQLGLGVAASAPPSQDVATGSVVFGLLEVERHEGAAAVESRLTDALRGIDEDRAMETVLSLLAALQDPQPLITTLTNEATAPEEARRERVLRLLWRIEPGAAAQPAALLEILEASVAARPVDYWASACLERWINRADQRPELLPRVEALALEAIRTGSGRKLSPLAYAVAGAGPGFIAPREVRSRLLAAILTSPGAPAEQLPELLARGLPDAEWAVEQLLDRAEGAGEDMEKALLRAAIKSAPFARLLSRRRFSSEGDHLWRFFAKLDEGVPPEKAGDAVLQDVIRGG